MKVKSFIRNIITICLIIIICICGYKIYSKLYEYKKADNIYNDLRKEKNYTNKNSSNKTNKNKENSIDFSHINKDFVCWINIKNALSKSKNKITSSFIRCFMIYLYK